MSYASHNYSFYRPVNAIFGKVCSYVISREIVFLLITHVCLYSSMF